ncbi:MAG TPA: beta-ketoacyl synthase N-terminal-like domain-containing protein [Micromonosporaceae bacterium]
MSGRPVPPSRVAVTGAGILCAIADSLETFAAALYSGRSGIGVRSVEATGGTVLSADLTGFDFPTAVAARAALPEELRRVALRVSGRAPLAVRAAVTVALQAWEAAELHRVPVAGERIGVVVGGHNLAGAYTERLRPRYDASPVYLPGRFALHMLDTDHVGMVSQILGITGEGFTVGGASASGNVALINACRLLAAGEVDVCLVIGALADLSAMERQAFVNLGAMAGARGTSDPGSRARPFDADREGFVPGEAAACLVLESAESVRRRGVRPLGGVAGYALRLDGNSLADPDAAGEARAMAEALRRAGLNPADVDYVNSHGTGSRLGDETEVAALHKVFGSDIGRPWVNSTKGLLGHTLWAAGVVEAVATLVQLRDGFVHPNANLEHPIDAACRFVGTRAQRASLRVAMSNAFGFGGFNTSVVLTAAEPATESA